MPSLRARASLSSGASHPLVGSMDVNPQPDDLYLPLGNVSSAWDVISLEAGLFNSTLLDANVQFAACFPPKCPTHESQATLIAAVKRRVATGGIVQFSMGGSTAPGGGFLQLQTLGAFNNFVTSIRNIVQKYGFNGVNIDLWMTGCVSTRDTDFQKPADSTSVYLISTMQKLRAIFGPNFTLSVASSFAFDDKGALDASTSCLSVLHALRDDLDFISIYPVPLYANQLVAPDGNNYSAISADYWVATADIALRNPGTAVYNTTLTFPALQPNQTFIYLLAPSGVDPTSAPPHIQIAMNCLTAGERCEAYKLQSGPYPAFRGFMAQSINVDESEGAPFRTAMQPFLDDLSSRNTSIASFLPPTGTATAPQDSSTTLSAGPTTSASKGTPPGTIAVAVAVPLIVVALLVAGVVAAWRWKKREQRRRALQRPTAYTVDIARSEMMSVEGSKTGATFGASQDGLTALQSLSRSGGGSTTFTTASTPRSTPYFSSTKSGMRPSVDIGESPVSPRRAAAAERGANGEPSERMEALQAALQNAGFTFNALLTSLHRVHEREPDLPPPPEGFDVTSRHSHFGASEAPPGYGAGH